MEPHLDDDDDDDDDDASESTCFGASRHCLVVLRC